MLTNDAQEKLQPLGLFGPHLYLSEGTPFTSRERPQPCSPDLHSNVANSNRALFESIRNLFARRSAAHL